MISRRQAVFCVDRVLLAAVEGQHEDIKRNIGRRHVILGLWLWALEAAEALANVTPF